MGICHASQYWCRDWYVLQNFFFSAKNFKYRLFALFLGIESNGDITVNFPEQNRWTGLLSEMERVEPSESNVTANPPSPLLGSFDSATVAATLQGG